MVCIVELFGTKFVVSAIGFRYPCVISSRSSAGGLPCPK